MAGTSTHDTHVGDNSLSDAAAVRAGHVTSKDGTQIAYDCVGSGPTLVLVDGALCHRRFGPSRALAKALAADFTVVTYDRRGRGDSGNVLPWAAAREVEDLGAVIAAVGGSAFVCGVSSGAALALEAANCGLPIKKLALYEAPFIVDAARAAIGPEYLDTLKTLVAQDRRGAAVRHFMKAVQVPAIVVALMHLAPAWSKLKVVAPTLVHDVSLVEPYWRGHPLPPERWSSVRVPSLILDGAKSPAWMRNAQRALASVVPGATTGTLPKQTHMVSPTVLAPALAEFFLDRR
jgi:pimeloyl-ACP methyl ester carboxylesterase